MSTAVWHLGLGYSASVFVCYFVMMPMALAVSAQYAEWFGFKANQWRAEEYISFVAKFMLGMGIGFELPSDHSDSGEAWGAELSNTRSGTKVSDRDQLCARRGVDDARGSDAGADGDSIIDTLRNQCLGGMVLGATG